MSGRGAGRAAAAVLLVASSWLAFGVGADPSGAANTAAEYLVDGGADGVAGSRPFAGRDRYDTALLLARRYAAVRGGLGSVRTAIVVSGESPPDAAAVAGFAGVENAPVLLVRPGGLHRAAADFLEDHDVKQIFVVGGPAAVPAEVVAQLADLDSQPQVTRLAGEDRYATAAAVASHIGGRAAWCTSNDSTAVLINGDERSAIDAAAIGPLTYALGLPTVLTRTSQLPEATAQFLREHDIDHAVVVGRAGAVTESVITQLGHAGVSRTTRLEGSGAAQIAVRIADLMHGDCAFASGRRASMVALVGRDAVIDGMVAAPLLGEGLGSGRAVPVLVAGDSLPAETATWLAATPVEVDRLKTHLRIVAIGGSGAVSSEAMAAAVKAATTGGPFTATIAARAGERSFTITTSDALNVELPDAQGKAHDLLYINDVPVDLAPVAGLDVLPGEPCLEPRRFKINLRHPLAAGDVIELRPTEVRFGARDDRRPFSPARFVVPEPAVDTAAPKVRIVAPAGSESLLAVISDDSGLDEIIVNPRQVRVITRSGTAVVVAEDTSEVLPLHEIAMFTLRLTAPGGAYRLEPGDRMLLRHGVAVDAAGNRSRAGSVSVTAPQHALRAVSISVAAANTRDEASTDAVSGGTDADADVSRARVLLAGTLRITARDSGDAAGALGNTWEVRTSRLSTHDPAAEQIGIDIAVSSRDRIISIRFASGTPSFGQLADALNADAGFAPHFEADATGGICAGRAQPVDLAHPHMDGATRLAGGVTVAEVTVRFDNLVRRYRSDGQNLPCPLTGTGVGQEAVADAEAGAREFVEHVLSGMVTDFTTLAAAEGAGDLFELEAPVPYDQMKFRYTTLDPSRGSLLGVSRYDVVEIPAGAVCGYGADDPATSEDERLSVSSRLRPQRR
ncbi:cell wall-binding repeat-containing protein [Candidatus Poriferisodalis sp.]|uniref:cell wall-binding repeat-containing protein n=1 Tax=Candidatus Poriferisodalis sp. TaxID=3101277 RepID=UPI003B02B0D4